MRRGSLASRVSRPLGSWCATVLCLLLSGCSGTDSDEAADPARDGGSVVVVGSRSFDRWTPLEDSGATSANVSIGDLDADGHLDILLVKGRHWPLENLVLLGDGAGGFRRSYPLGAPADRSYSGALVDLDGDGDLDVVVSNDDPDPKRVHLNDGSGRFSMGDTFGRGEWSTRHLRIGDLNGDGLPDAVLANRYGSREGPSYVCLGEAGGRFRTECRVVTLGSATTIVPEDLDGDGDLDLVVPHRDGGQSFVYHNDGSGAFDERVPFGPADASIRSALPLHLDDDGIMDLVVIDEATGPAVFHGREDGSYGDGEPLGSATARPYSLATADVDGNGRTDVLIGFVEAPPVVWFNDGPQERVSVSFGDALGTAYGFAVGDLDEDGLMDVAIARSGAPNVLYFGGRPTSR
jgi:hypothetical protein